MTTDWNEVERRRGDIARREVELKTAVAGGLLPAHMAAERARALADEKAAFTSTFPSAREIYKQNEADEAVRAEIRKERFAADKLAMTRMYREQVTTEAFRVFRDASRFVSDAPPPSSVSRGLMLKGEVRWVAPETGHAWLAVEHQGALLNNCVIVTDPNRRVHYSIGQQVTVYVLHLRNIQRDLYGETEPSRFAGFYVSAVVEAEAALRVGQVLPASVKLGEPGRSVLSVAMPDGSSRNVAISHPVQRGFWGLKNKAGKHTQVVVKSIFDESSPGLSVFYEHAPGARFA